MRAPWKKCLFVHSEIRHRWSSHPYMFVTGGEYRHINERRNADRACPQVQQFSSRKITALLGLPPLAEWTCSAWLGHICSLIQAAQKQIRVAEMREHANCSLGRQPCRATVRSNSDKRNADATACTGIPDTIANVNSAADSAISPSGPLHRQPDDGLSVQRIVARRRRVIIVAQASTCHFETRRVAPRPGSKG